VGAIALAMLSPTEPGRQVPGVLPASPGVGSPAVAPATGAGAPEVVPVITPPETTLTRELEIELSVTIPESDVARQGLELKVARNGSEVGAVRRPRAGEVAVRDIQLEEGENTLTAWLSNAAGSGPTSSPVVVIVDKTAPELQVSEPKERTEVATMVARVAGQVELGAQVSVETPDASATRIDVIERPDGTFEQTVRLVVGDNRVKVTAVDPAGNRVTITRHVLRLDGRPSVSLQVRPERLSIDTLPRQLKVVAVVKDEAGRPVEGASVVFSLSLRGQAAQTDDAVTDADGRAEWSPLVSDQGAQPGDGLLSAEVRLPGGRDVVAQPRDIVVS
jgi:hypothetical protein